ncbi:MAG TPA: hypothetical protein VGO49_20250, partial [Bradyrhizobium sp.]|nr:hypothetical protein [Bradyrhizobium sp.]
MGQSPEFMSLEQRAGHYRALANDAFHRAANSESGEARAGYLSMASGWHTLATEMERAISNQQPATSNQQPATSNQQP